jgi:hypothetical protein
MKVARAVGLFAAFTLIDPLGLASTTNKLSEELVYRLLSLQSQAAADHISVVLVDDRSAQEINGESGYPITFAQHAAALTPMMCAGPAALFIDITFRGVRGEPAVSDPDRAADPLPTPIDPLLKALALRPSATDEYCRLPDVARFHPIASPRVLMARTRSHPPDDCDPLYGRALADECRVGRVIDRLASVSTPISAGDVMDDGTYRLVNKPDKDDASASSALEPSPALAMVLAFCEAAQGTPRAHLRGCRDIDALRALLTGTDVDNRYALYPVWSFFKTRGYVEDRTVHARDGKANTVGSGTPTCDLQMRRDVGFIEQATLISREFWRLLFSFGGNDSPFEQEPCLAADTISLNDLRQMASFCGESGNACGERVAKFFSGRMIFYGIDITGINDLAPTPVVGLVPGAAYHAAAAETLLNYGKGYHRPPGSFAGIADFAKLADIILFAAAAILIKIAFHLKFGDGNGRCVANWIICATLIVIGMAAVFSLVLAIIGGLSALSAVAGILSIAVYCGLMTAIFMFRIDKSRSCFVKAGRRLAGMAIGLVIVVPAALLMTILLHFPPGNIIASVLMLTQLPAD